VSIGIAVVLSKSTLVFIEAAYSVTVETFVAGALEATSSVHARSVWRAVVQIIGALVDLVADDTVAHEARLARALE